MALSEMDGARKRDRIKTNIKQVKLNKQRNDDGMV